MGLVDSFYSLARNINKVKPAESEDKAGVVSEPSDELSLDTPDTELIAKAAQWEKEWQESKKKVDLERKQLENEKYWLGDHSTPAQKSSGSRELVDNLVFEGLETFLPVATRQNPEPSVSSDNTPEGNALARKVSDRLADLADTLRLKLKIRKAARHWALYYLGCIKLGWSVEHNEIAIQVKRPQQLILDPNAITDECEYEGEYIGEYRTESAGELIKRFPENSEYIQKEVKEKLGTKIRYVEWWTSDFLFWSYKEKVLGKSKNPHWNYDTVQQLPEVMDESGNVTPGGQEVVPGNNHFVTRKIPYAMLSVFNLGKSPFDDTNCIEQVLPLQDVVNKRQRQIDKNADGQNGGAIVSGDSFTKDEAKQVSDALRKGATVWVPRGDVNAAYKRDQGAQLPAFVYQSLIDYRNELRNIFGTTGLSSQGIKSEDTVRGKILIKGTDTDRASLVVGQLEQFADYIFNWMVQLMYVYYDEPRNVSRYQGAVTIVNEEFVKPIVVSVKEGSLIPKDRLTQRNEAIDLWSANALDPITLFERLEDPDPYERAKKLFLWSTNPISLFPDLQAQMAPVAPTGGVEGEPSPLLQEEPTPPKESLLNEVPIQ